MLKKKSSNNDNGVELMRLADEIEKDAAACDYSVDQYGVDYYRDGYRFYSKVTIASVLIAIVVCFSAAGAYLMKEPGRTYATMSNGDVIEIFPEKITY